MANQAAGFAPGIWVGFMSARYALGGVGMVPVDVGACTGAAAGAGADAAGAVGADAAGAVD